MLIAVGIFAAAMVVYTPTMKDCGFIWDDNLLMTHNRLMNTPGGLRNIWEIRFEKDPSKLTPADYYPITWTSLYLEWRRWGRGPDGDPTNARPYHVSNVLQHALACVLLWGVLCRLKIPAAWMVALIFAVHPVNVASVAWISERKNTLSIVFFMLSVLAYLIFDDRKHWRWYVLSLLAFWAAMMSKASVVALPVVLLGGLWWRHDRVWGRDLWRMLPFLVIAVVLAYINWHYQKTYAAGDEVVRIDGFFSRLAGAGAALWFYFYKALIPRRLLMLYPQWRIDPTSLRWYLPGLLYLGCLVILAASLIRYKKRWAKAPLAMLLYHAAMLFPVLGFFNFYYMLYAHVADHWQYMAIIGIISLVVGGTWYYCRRWARLRLVATVAGLVVVITLAVLTWRQQRHYVNQIALWEYNLPHNPEAWVGQYNMGTKLSERALVETDPIRRREIFLRAEKYLREAIRLRPHYAAAHNNLGLVVMNLDRVTESLALYREAVRQNPNYIDACLNQGLALWKLGRFGEAAEQYNNVLARHPDHVPARMKLGLVLADMGRKQEEIEQFQRVLSAFPGHLEANLHLARVYLAENNLDAATVHLNRLMQSAPDHPQTQLLLGQFQQSRGNLAVAAAAYSQALKLSPTLVGARLQLAQILVATHRSDEALRHLRIAAQQAPQAIDVRNALAMLLARAGRIDEAIRQYQQALVVNPNSPILLNNLARLLATNEDARLRDGRQAVQLAQRACHLTQYNQPMFLGTLGAAYAELGQFNEAVDTASKALQIATASHQKQLAQKIQREIQRYQAHQPLRMVPTSQPSRYSN